MPDSVVAVWIYHNPARPLPVAAAQMQPHSKFIEGERHGGAVGQRGQAQVLARGCAKQKVGADAGNRRFTKSRVGAARSLPCRGRSHRS
jgi:hypothetical protein